MMGLEIEMQEIDKRIVLRLDGRIDAITSPVLEKKMASLIEDGHKDLILDFSKVDYLSSAGMRLLLSVTKKLKAMKGRLVIFSVQEDVLEIIKMAGFERVLTLCNLEQEALQIFLKP
jgi:anti-anti-sigma factor